MELGEYSQFVPLVGLVCMVLGGLIMTFDYPQIEYLGGFDTDSTTGAGAELQALHGRLVVEFAAGAAILAAGIAMCVPGMASLFWQKRGVR